MSIDSVIEWFYQPATYDNLGDLLMVGFIILVMGAIIVVSIFGKAEE